MTGLLVVCAVVVLLAAVAAAFIADWACDYAEDSSWWPRLFVGFTLLFTATTAAGWWVATRSLLLVPVVFAVGYGLSEWLVRPMPKRGRA